MEALQGLEASLELAVTDSKARVDQADAEKEARHAAVSRAESILAECEAVIPGKEAALVAQIATVKAAQTALREAQHAETSGNLALDAALAKKQEIEQARCELYLPLLESGGESAEGKKRVAALVARGKDFGLEASLLSTLPSVLTQPAEARGAFGQLVLAQLEQALAACVTEQEALLAEGEAGRQERASAVRGADAVHEAAKATKADVLADLEKARSARRDANKNLTSAQEAVADFLPDLLRRSDQLEKAVAALASLQAGALAALAELRTAPAAGEQPKVPAGQSSAPGEDTEGGGPVAA